MAATPNPVHAIQKAIIKTLSKEQNRTGNNPTGRLPTVKVIGKSWINAIPEGAYPYVGIVPVREQRNDKTVGIRMREFRITWTVLCAVTKGEDEGGMDAAYSALYDVVNDGNGNGVAEILEDPSNFTLGGTIEPLTITTIQQVDYTDDLLKDPQGGTDQFAAYAIITYMTVCYITVQGAIS